MEKIDRSVILVVDDTPENLQLMSTLLRDHYKVQVAGSGEKALKLMAGGVSIFQIRYEPEPCVIR